VNSSTKHSVRTMVDMQNSISKHKIDTAKLRYSSLLNLSNIEISPSKGGHSLSVYGGPDIKERSIS
jgi:hypothetical protein